MSIVVSEVRLLTRLIFEVIYFLSSSCMCSCKEQLILTLFSDAKSFDKDELCLGVSTMRLYEHTLLPRMSVAAC